LVLGWSGDHYVFTETPQREWGGAGQGEEVGSSPRWHDTGRAAL
jgi:hypothetical protein